MKIAEVVTVLALTLFPVAARGADVVYDNSTDFSGANYESTNEYGDEVILAGTARAVTEIQIEYYARFTPQGDELGRVRFYANTGPIWMGNPDFHEPGEPPLFEDTFELGQDYQAVSIPVPNVVVPNSFTWTVQFLGISQTSTNDRAGLLFYSTPTIGASYDDFWERTATGWQSFDDNTVPKSNFAARILAVAAPPQLQLTITRVGTNLLITWPSGDPSFKLEAKTSLGSATWTQITTTPTLNGARYEVIVPLGSGNQFFRLRSP